MGDSIVPGYPIRSPSRIPSARGAHSVRFRRRALSPPPLPLPCRSRDTIDATGCSDRSCDNHRQIKAKSHRICIQTHPTRTFAYRRTWDWPHTCGKCTATQRPLRPASADTSDRFWWSCGAYSQLKCPWWRSGEGEDTTGLFDVCVGATMTTGIRQICKSLSVLYARNLKCDMHAQRHVTLNGIRTKHNVQLDDNYHHAAK